MHENEAGFTTSELLFTIFGISSIISVVALVYVLVHFIAKVW